MIDTADIIPKVLVACEEDHVGLWEIVRMVEREFPSWDAVRIRNTTLDFLQDLLTARKIEAGFPAKDGLEFEAWNMPVAAIMTKLENEWTAERRPSIGEVAWFTAPVRVRQSV